MIEVLFLFSKKISVCETEGQNSQLDRSLTSTAGGESAISKLSNTGPHELIDDALQIIWSSFVVISKFKSQV